MLGPLGVRVSPGADPELALELLAIEGAEASSRGAAVDCCRLHDAAFHLVEAPKHVSARADDLKFHVATRSIEHGQHRVVALVSAHKGHFKEAVCTGRVFEDIAVDSHRKVQILGACRRGLLWRVQQVKV